MGTTSPSSRLQHDNYNRHLLTSLPTLTLWNSYLRFFKHVFSNRYRRHHHSEAGEGWSGMYPSKNNTSYPFKNSRCGHWGQKDNRILQTWHFCWYGDLDRRAPLWSLAICQGEWARDAQIPDYERQGWNYHDRDVSVLPIYIDFFAF